MIYIDLLIDGPTEHYLSKIHHPRQYQSFLKLLSVIDREKKLKYQILGTDFISVRIDGNKILQYKGFDDRVVVMLKTSRGILKVETIYDDSGIPWETNFFNDIMNDI